MNTTWLLIDANNVASQCYYAMGGAMTHNDIATGVVFGFLRDIANLIQRFKTTNIAFCFDHGKPLRCKLLPTYKANRKPETIEEKENRSERNKQINMLRTEYLPAIGFKNVFWQEGYEADDILAEIARPKILKTDWMPTQQPDYIIVSSDKDLYQCLAKNVNIWNRGKLMDVHGFMNEWHIDPRHWKKVKALAGCSSDNIPGIPGVGEKTAIKFLKGELKSTTKAYQAIQAQPGLRMKNNQLVTLPFTGCKTPELVKDEVTRETWNAFAKKFGMESLLGGYPSQGLPTLSR